jgi:hypothetical protein
LPTPQCTWRRAGERSSRSFAGEEGKLTRAIEARAEPALLSGMRWPLLLVLIALAGCAGLSGGTDSAAMAYPVNYKADLLAFLRTYLNDPSNVRDAFISEPSLRTVGTETRYVVCVRYDARRSGEYAASRERMAVYLGGRFDRFIESAREQCGSAIYRPFPELERLSR